MARGLFFALPSSKMSATFIPHSTLDLTLVVIPYYSLLLVLKPKGAYNGQKLIKLVSAKITAATTNTIPNTPATIPWK